MSFMDAREAGSKPGSGGAASQQNEVTTAGMYAPLQVRRELILL